MEVWNQFFFLKWLVSCLNTIYWIVYINWHLHFISLLLTEGLSCTGVGERKVGSRWRDPHLQMCRLQCEEHRPLWGMLGLRWRRRAVGAGWRGRRSAWQCAVGPPTGFLRGTLWSQALSLRKWKVTRSLWTLGDTIPSIRGARTYEE